MYDSPLDDDNGWYGREATILLEDNGVLACGFVLCIDLLIVFWVFLD